MTKINASITSALVIIGMTACLLVQHRTLAELRLDNQGLRRQSEQLTRLCADIRAAWPQASASGPTNLAERLAVDCAVDCGPVSHCGSGFLFGFSDDGLDPPDSDVVPLKIRLHRTRLSLAKAQANRMRRRFAPLLLP